MSRVDVDEMPELPRWPWVTLIVVIVLGALVLAAKPVARQIRAWQAQRLANEAEALGLRGQVRAALKQLQEAAILSPGEPEVARKIAHLLGAVSPGEPGTVAAWERVAQARPGAAVELELILHRLLGGGEATAARRGYEALPGEARESLRGRYLRALLDLPGSRESVGRALEDLLRRLPPRTQPGPADYNTGALRLLLARLRLEGVAAEQTQALEVLRELQQLPLWAPQAGRMLRDAHLQRGDFAAAQREAEALTKLPEATADSFLGVAAVQLASGDRAALLKTITDLRARAREDRILLGLLLAWLHQSGERALATEIAERTPDDELCTAAVTVAVMPVLDRAGLLDRLRLVARKGDWTGREAEREAWQARLAALSKEPLARQKAWADALEAAGDQTGTLRRLLELARAWGWTREAESVLARLALQPTADRTVLEDWWQTNVALRSARGVLSACRRLLESGDRSLPVRNDYAAMALLLGEDTARAQRLALENYEARPNDAIFLTTYAASLRLQGRLDDAARLLASAPPNAPAVIFERVRLLAAQGRREEASGLAAQVPASVLFPEQAAWLAELRRTSVR
ncbi:MAG: hypothetical protein JSR82_16450 [Verrucomicrobia bacterium]|nr:hypothetical protein [Verrucomicrobiota bacterium]